MKTVRQLLQAKGDVVYTVTPETTVFDALKLMAEKNIGAVLAVADGRIAGIMTERDYARKVILFGKSSREMTVREIMSEQVLAAHPSRTVEECMALMTDKRVRHLPVMDAGKLIGLLSIGDLVKEVIADQEFTIQQLVSYIHG